MNKTKAGDTLQDLCATCGKRRAGCTCRSLEISTQWPMAGNRPRSGEEMSARFSELKEAGSGTLFIDTSSQPRQSQGTSIDLAPEAVIGGVYKIIRLIGRGGMGEVYMAKHMTLDKRCALKVIPPDQVTDISWQRFQLEAKAVAKLEHVNLVRVTDLGIHEGCLPFYAMEYLVGNNLAELLAEHGPMPLNSALEVFMQVCDGVACAHRGGIFHRDLKPANIMLTPTQTGRLEVKVLDFGLAKLTKHDRFTQSLTGDGEVFGSPHYMSPEQSQGSEIDARSDIYSLGCTLFKTLTGTPPFCGDTAFQTILLHQTEAAPSLNSIDPKRDFPQPLEDLVQRMLAKVPEDRYQSMDQICNDLGRLQQGKTLTNSVVTIPVPCTVCRKQIADCTCTKLEESAGWPVSGDSPGAEVEMSARFSILKEEGKGTTFISHPQTQNPEGDTSIDLAPDAIIGGVYKIIKLLGYGAMGEVYLAKHMTLGKKCALKVIPPNQVTDVAWKRFQLEAKAVAKLDHVNLVRVTDLGIHEDCLPYYAMEYLQGKNLAEALADDGPIPLKKTLEIFIQVCDGVDCAHQSGMMHRDLKPANIMMTETPTGKMEVKILDFGLAKLTKHNRFKQSLTAVGDVFGSPSYMSPEQCGGEELDNRSDIYSIGCTLFECLTGRPPFVGQVAAAVFMGHLVNEPPTLESVVGPGVFPQALEEIMAKLLRKNPDERYQTMAELKADLERSAGGKSSPAASGGRKAGKKKGSKQHSATLPPRLPARKNRSTMPLLVGLGLVVLVGIGSSVFIQIYAKRKASVEASQRALAKPNKVAAIGVAPAATAGGSIVVDPNAATSTPPVDDADDKWDGTPFYKGIVQKDGQKFQHWSYKSDHPPLVSLSFEGPQGPKRIGLSGDVYIPAAAKVSLFLRQNPTFPSIRLKALNGANIDEISFGRYSLEDVEKTVPTLAKCKSIQSVRLGDAAWSDEDSRASADVINQFPTLERLSLSFKCAPDTLMKIHRLKALKELKLNRSQPNLHDCLKLITGLDNLTSLGLSSWSLPVSDLGLVAQCPHLEKVMIGRLTGSPEQFSILAKLPHLQLLDMPVLRYRPDLASDLRLLKSLKTLRFAITPEWNNAVIAQLRHDLPNVQVELYVGLTGRSGRRHVGGRRSTVRPGVPQSGDQPGASQFGDQPGGAPSSD